MALVTTKELLLDAQKNGYAVGAFNVENMEMVQAVVAAAEELKSPVIMQTTPSTLKYAGPDMYYANVAAAAKKASVPVVMHLDHGSSFELAIQAFRAGYTSIMIDGSHSVFEENIAITKSVVDACHAGQVPVEAELGKVGGKEDDLDGGNGGYTVPSEAAEFVERTGVDSLAVAIGTAHGAYPKGMIPKLDFERLKELKAELDMPLVLHGGSGAGEENIRKAVACGINKINVCTDLMRHATNASIATLKENPQIDYMDLCIAVEDAMKDFIKSYMRVIGSSGRYSFEKHNGPELD